jgi:hypothetical protein
MDTGAAEGEGGSGSGSGNLQIRDNNLLLSARTTRADLEKLINSSIRPLYIKQEILEGENTVVEAMDEDDDDIVLDNVVTGAAADPDAGAASDSDYSESEEEERDEEMEERPDDPIAAVRNLFEREEGLAGADNDNVDPPIVIKPALDNRYFTVKGLRKKTGHGTDWSEAGEAAPMERTSFLLKEDDRILFNSNSFNLDKARNV